MHESLRQFREKFRVDELTIAQSDHWIWSLRPGQCTLGAGILSLKSYTAHFSYVGLAAGADLAGIVKVIESTAHNVFAYDKINYLMLMMVDPHVHFHVLPRYGRSIDFADMTWKDAGWPKTPVLDGGAVDDAVLIQIRDALKQRG